jgi:hypothetical protein
MSNNKIKQPEVKLTAEDTLNVMKVTGFLKKKTPEEAALLLLKHGSTWDADLRDFAMNELNKDPLFKASGRFNLSSKTDTESYKEVSIPGSKGELVPSKDYLNAKRGLGLAINDYNQEVLKRGELLEEYKATKEEFEKKADYLNTLINVEKTKDKYSWNPFNVAAKMVPGGEKMIPAANVVKNDPKNRELIEQMTFEKSVLHKLGVELNLIGNPSPSRADANKAKAGGALLTDPRLHGRAIEYYDTDERYNRWKDTIANYQHKDSEFLTYNTVNESALKVSKALKLLNIYETKENKTLLPEFGNAEGLKELPLIDTGEE